MDDVQNPKIKPKERKAVITALRAGVTPHIGLQHIQVGREGEVKAMLKDIDAICEGNSTFRLVIGDFGSGKSFFLHLTRTIALQQGLVTVHADLTQDHRLAGTGGRVRNLYAELMKNLSTQTKPDGGALPSVVERFINEAKKEATVTDKRVPEIIENRLILLREFVGGYDFAKVLSAYWQGHESGNESLKSDAIRWLRGEFSTKVEARKTLDVRTIVDDTNVYDHIKLMSLFVRQAGYKGLLVNLDEMVYLYKLSNSTSRVGNYEQILRILNDCLQGTPKPLGFLLAGTSDFLTDPRKGLFSYEALRTRLAENSFSVKMGITDYSAPVLRLARLTPEELFVLLKNVRHIFASGDTAKYLLPDDALVAFLSHCQDRIGSAVFQTPRNTIKGFVDLLALLEQTPSLAWSDLIQRTQVKKEENTDMGPEITDDDSKLANFKL